MDSPKRRLRIAFDQRLTAYRMGGISRYVSELGRELETLPDIDLIRIRHRKDGRATVADLTLRTPPHHRFEPLAVGIELALQRRELDVYHATDFVAPLLVRQPVVASIQDLAFIRWPDQLSRDSLRYYRKVGRQLGRVDHWIVPSAWTKSELMSLVGVPAADITVIPHGLSSFVKRGNVRGRCERGSHVVAVGTIEPRKRYDLLLDAFERMSPQPELTIVGAAGWNTELVQQRLRSTPGVTWLDHASDTDIDRLLSNAIALALPSLAEGFGLGALEAMARGTPVISSGLGALPEVTGPVAVVPQRDDPDSWAQAIESVIEDNELWQRCSDSGLARVEEFTWSKAARQTAEVYRRVAS